MIRKYIISILLSIIFTSCTDNGFDGSVEMTLQMNIAKPTLIGAATKNVTTRSASSTLISNEQKIDNIWVFQYAYNESTPTSSTLIETPRYYTLSGTTNLKLLLQTSQTTKSQIFVVANTNSNTWASDFAKGSSLASLNSKITTLTTESAIYGNGNNNLMMIGSNTPTIVTSQTLISVPLTRLLAKITFTFTIPSALNLSVTNVGIYNVPGVIRCGAPTSSEIFPLSTSFNAATYSETAVSAGTKTATYTWYVPENQQGTTSGSTANLKNDLAPQNALYVRLYADFKDNGNSYVYTVYPGGNEINDFNIKRNYNYNVNLNINAVNLSDSRVDASPANCFVVTQNSTIRFDPYNRTETGGGFKYSDYVNENDVTKKITSVKVLWQTGNGTSFAIGNNSSGNLVYMLDGKIYVKTGNINGNALIAGYNSNNQIVWSWHIWVNNKKPANVANAVKYMTYKWDATGIYTDQMVQGHSFMSCNLGAEDSQAQSYTSYGLYYQWGRKDPFLGANKILLDPSAESGSLADFPYTSANIQAVYDNNCTLIDMPSTEGNSGSLFKAVTTSASIGTIPYSISNPTTFICATTTIGDESTLINYGDWYFGQNDRLWGGIPYNEATVKYTAADGTMMANNGATAKSIFDPCPAGWMLPPADAYMIFTSTGLSAASVDSDITNVNVTSGTYYGFTYYVGGWHIGPTSYFPFNGTRMCSGLITRPGICGVYRTSAATPSDNRAYTLHCHNWDGTAFANPWSGAGDRYSYRGNGAPARCVLINE